MCASNLNDWLIGSLTAVYNTVIVSQARLMWEMEEHKLKSFKITFSIQLIGTVQAKALNHNIAIFISNMV